jgi:hypothetical protein
LLNMTYVNIGKQPPDKYYQAGAYEAQWVVANQTNSWAQQLTVQKFSITKIELIPYNM